MSVIIERVTSLDRNVARMDRARKIASQISQCLEAAGMTDWSFMLCSWTYGEQPVIVTGTIPGVDLLESMKDGAQWILKCVDARKNGDELPIVTGRP